MESQPLIGTDQPPLVSQIEAGSRIGTVDVLKRIAEALRVDLDDLT